MREHQAKKKQQKKTGQKLAKENQQKNKTGKTEIKKKLAGQISQVPQVPTRLWEWKNRNVASYQIFQPIIIF